MEMHLKFRRWNDGHFVQGELSELIEADEAYMRQ